MPTGIALYSTIAKLVLRLLSELVFLLLDWAATVSVGRALRTLALFALVWLVWARVLQAIANHRVKESEKSLSGFRMELMGSVLALPFLPFILLWWGLKSLFSRKKKAAQSPSDGAPEGGESERPVAEASAPAPKLRGVLVVTHGPAYLSSAGWMVAALLLSRLAEPLLGTALGLSDFSFTWSYLLLGWHPAAHALVPLNARPGLALVLSAIGWGTAWWCTARVVRIGRGAWLNRFDSRSSPESLPEWPRWGGSLSLYEPAKSFQRWAWPALGGSALLLVIGLSATNASVYRIDASFVVVGALVVLSQFLNLWLRGFYLPVEEEPKKDESVPSVEAKGWEDVVADLGTRLQAEKPPEQAIPVPIQPLLLKDGQPAEDGLVSAMVLELLPEVDGKRRLTEAQEHVLRAISAQASQCSGKSVAGCDEQGLKLSGAQRARTTDEMASRIVVGPEGVGRTMLTWLAACNHVVSHTRAVLVIARDDDAADRWRAGLDELLQPSTLRWTVRVRRAGVELREDLARRVLPDVLVCSLKELVGDLLLGDHRSHDFLRQVGLLVLDDVDAFVGPVEVHAHFAMQRLHTRLRQLQGIEVTRRNASVPVLATLGDSMHEPGTWAQALLGTEVSIDQPVSDADELYFQEAARELAHGKSEAPEVGADEAPEKKQLRERIEKARKGPHQLRFRIADMAAKTGRRITVADVVASCERLSVPWAYRTAGDGRRHIGRSVLRLQSEPRCYVDDVEKAAVVFLDGEWSAVRREMRRIPRAGSQFSRHRYPGGKMPSARELERLEEPIALISLADPDVDMAFTENDRTSKLSPRLDELPYPLVRVAVGDVARAHLGADLVSGWLEVGDVVRVYDVEGVNALKGLAARNMLLTEVRRVLARHADAYEDTLLVHATAEAVRDPLKIDIECDAVRLPPPVESVETSLVPCVVVRDRVANRDLRLVDKASAPFRYYKGRRFQESFGRFVVAALRTSQAGEGMIEVEPVLDDSISSPRRVVTCEVPLALVERNDYAVRFAPLALGKTAIAVRVAPTTVRLRHLATLQLGPELGELRRRELAADWRLGDSDEGVGRSERRAAEAVLETEALWIQVAIDDERKGEAPLNLSAARLIAAVMRAVLPVYYRGGEEALGVALHVGSKLADDDELAATDAFVFYDLDAVRNGAAQALRRDGVETLLRLSRLMIERVLYQDRLLARYDEWPVEEELLQIRPPRTTDERMGEEQSRRHRALQWLDDVLAPEGGSSSITTIGDYTVDAEGGEGDFFDRGRVWYSADGTVTNLVWTRHRWRDENEAELGLDIGLDRRTAASARAMTENDELLAEYRALLEQHAADPANALPDGRVHGMPMAAFSGEAKPTDPQSVAQWQGYFKLAYAVASYDCNAVAPLAGTLARLAGTTPDAASLDLATRHRLATALARFVQGIRYAVPDKLRGQLRPPVSTLVYRVGDCDSRSVLLALMLRHCGMDSGLFVSGAESHAICAAAVPESIAADSDPAAIQAAVAAWAESVGIEMPRVWAAQPESTEPGAPLVLYVPIECTGYFKVGHVPIKEPASWVFLPFSAVRKQVGLTESADPTDDHGLTTDDSEVQA